MSTLSLIPTLLLFIAQHQTDSVNTFTEIVKVNLILLTSFVCPLSYDHYQNGNILVINIYLSISSI
jgi:hypothetical protein